MVKAIPELKIEQTTPLKWPQGWPRTRIADRKAQASWKKTSLQVLASLEKELRGLGVSSALLTTTDKLIAPITRDPSVALWFSRKPDEDYSWQEVLGIENPLPTIDEIDTAFRKVGLQHHPDRGGDQNIFNTYQDARKRAKEFVLGTHTHEHQYGIACDVFKEVRWNLNAIRLTLGAIRQTERCGTSSMIERAFTGFKAQLTAEASQSSEGAA